MSELEELEKKKKELLLKQEIAELERKERIRSASNNFAKWSWWWVAPLSLVGAVFFFGGINAGDVAVFIFGIATLIPLGLKLFHGAGRNGSKG